MTRPDLPGGDEGVAQPRLSESYPSPIRVLSESGPSPARGSGPSIGRQPDSEQTRSSTACPRFRPLVRFAVIHTSCCDALRVWAPIVDTSVCAQTFFTRTSVLGNGIGKRPAISSVRRRQRQGGRGLLAES